MTESAIQKAICQYLRQQGYLFWRFSPATYNTKLKKHIKHEFVPNGLSDIMIVHPGDTKAFKYPTFIGLEVKSPKGRPSADQLFMQKRFGAANAEYYFVRSIEEVKALGL